jgi:hypothetical protein
MLVRPLAAVELATSFPEAGPPSSSFGFKAERPPVSADDYRGASTTTDLRVYAICGIAYAPLIEVKLCWAGSDHTATGLATDLPIKERNMDAKIFSVEQVSIGYTKSIPPLAIIGAIGTAPTSGWSNGRLAPRIYIAPPADGIWDFDFIATAPSGIALQVLSPITSEPFVTEVPEWFKGARVHASTNSKTDSDAHGAVGEKVGIVQFASEVATNGGPDVFPWKKPDSGADGFPWTIAPSLLQQVAGLEDDSALGATLGKLVGLLVRVHRESDPVTEDYRRNRINFVIAEDKPTIIRTYVG